jgi:hypothetical protein
MSYTSAEQTGAALAKSALRVALCEDDGSLALACGALDPGERKRLSRALSAADPRNAKTCTGPDRGFPRCTGRCMEDFLGRGRCVDGP